MFTQSADIQHRHTQATGIHRHTTGIHRHTTAAIQHMHTTGIHRQQAITGIQQQPFNTCHSTHAYTYCIQHTAIQR